MKHRFTALLTAAVTAFSAAAMRAEALTVPFGGSTISFETDKDNSAPLPEGVTGSAVITGISAPPEVLELPMFVDTANDSLIFAAIGEKAFMGLTEIKSVILPETITKIGDSAFAGCLALESITLPDSVTEMGVKVFVSCTQLRTADLGGKDSKLKAIPENCFSSCTNLTEVKIPDGVIGIGREAFYGCTSMRSMTIPPSVRFIGENAIGLHTNRIDNSIEPVPGFIIFGRKDSAAESYAKGKGIDFIDIEATPFGDVNMDGFVDSADASMVLSEYAELATGGQTTLSAAQRYLADVDGNGDTDSADASEILIIYAENATA